MRITGLGHASVLVETAHGTVLTDPWVNPAYFGSWFPFPDNSQLDWDAIGDVDYLFVSHLHRDHFDPETLAKHVSKRTTVLLPEYPTSELEDALRGCGFTSFVRPASGEVVSLDGLDVMGVEKLTDTAWIMRVRIKTQPSSRWAVARELNRRIKMRFDANAIESPFTSHKVLMRDPPAAPVEQGEAA